MEKTFQRLKSKRARRAFVEAELVNGVSSQIRVLRQQRGWSQKDLAELLGTTQGVVSRLEDPSYGRYSLKSLLDLSSAFDISLFVRFLPFSQAVPATWDTQREKLEADSFEDEINRVYFFAKTERYFQKIETKSHFLETTKTYTKLGADEITGHVSVGGPIKYEAVPRWTSNYISKMADDVQWRKL